MGSSSPNRGEHKNDWNHQLALHIKHFWCGSSAVDLMKPVALWPSCITFQCKNITNYTTNPHRQTIVQQTCASLIHASKRSLLRTKSKTQPTKTSGYPGYTGQPHIKKKQVDWFSSIIKSKALGFFANLGWTNLSWGIFTYITCMDTAYVREKPTPK